MTKEELQDAIQKIRDAPMTASPVIWHSRDADIFSAIINDLQHNLDNSQTPLTTDPEFK